MMAVVLPDNALTAQFPQSSIMVRARSHKIGAVGTERAVPDPALVSMQCRLERESSRVAVCSGRQIVAGRHVVRSARVDGPDAGRVIGGTGR